MGAVFWKLAEYCTDGSIRASSTCWRGGGVYSCMGGIAGSST